MTQIGMRREGRSRAGRIAGRTASSLFLLKRASRNQKPESHPSALFLLSRVPPGAGVGGFLVSGFQFRPYRLGGLPRVSPEGTGGVDTRVRPSIPDPGAEEERWLCNGDVRHVMR